MTLRPAVFGPQGWYPFDAAACQRSLDDYGRGAPDPRPQAVAGIVPHAGWVFSGRLACWTFRALAASSPAVVFLFGGHLGPGQRPRAMIAGAWETPLGPLPVEADLARTVAAGFDTRIEDAAHFEPDNTIELQLPILKHTWPAARVVAFQVPPGPVSAELGQACAEAAAAAGLPALAIGSTDLTHYGPNYGFSPRGAGDEALRWSKEQNDRPFLDRLLALDGPGAEEHALIHHSACCPGAAGAAVAFARARGARAGELLAHTTSHDVDPSGPARMWVGYASLVFG